MMLPSQIGLTSIDRLLQSYLLEIHSFYLCAIIRQELSISVLRSAIVRHVVDFATEPFRTLRCLRYEASTVLGSRKLDYAQICPSFIFESLIPFEQIYKK